MTDDLVGQMKASVTYEYMPMKVRRQLSEATARIEALEAEKAAVMDVLMGKRLIAEAAARAIDPARNLRLNPLYVGDPAWRIATAIQDAARAALAKDKSDG